MIVTVEHFQLVYLEKYMLKCILKNYFNKAENNNDNKTYFSWFNLVQSFSFCHGTMNKVKLVIL